MELFQSSRASPPIARGIGNETLVAACLIHAASVLLMLCFLPHCMACDEKVSFNQRIDQQLHCFF